MPVNSGRTDPPSVGLQDLISSRTIQTTDLQHLSFDFCPAWRYSGEKDVNVWACWTTSSMDTDLQSPAATPICSQTTSASLSSLGTAFCLSSSPKRSNNDQSGSKVRAGTPPRCPSLTPAMFSLPPMRGDCSNTTNGAINAAAFKQQKTQERKRKKEDVLVLFIYKPRPTMSTDCTFYIWHTFTRWHSPWGEDWNHTHGKRNLIVWIVGWTKLEWLTLASAQFLSSQFRDVGPLFSFPLMP